MLPIKHKIILFSIVRLNAQYLQRNDNDAHFKQVQCESQARFKAQKFGREFALTTLYNANHENEGDKGHHWYVHVGRV
jgi:hypothetical protein